MAFCPGGLLSGVGIFSGLLSGGLLSGGLLSGIPTSLLDSAAGLQRAAPVQK